jgi:hypothetical protein
MGHLSWALVLLAVAILVTAWWTNRRKLRELRFNIERHGLRLRQWRRVLVDETRDPWRCPECYLTAHGHWAKINHQRWHDAQSEQPEQPELWDSVSAEFIADRDAGTPELTDANRPEIEQGE